MFQFKAIHTACIGLFYIIVVVVIIDLVYNAYAERLTVTEDAEIYSCNIEMIYKTKVAFCF